MRLRGFEIVSRFAEANIALPSRKTAYSAGYDLAAAADVVIEPQQVTLIPTGLKAYMQPNEYLGVHIRSGLSVKHALSLINGQGIIDADYYNNPDNEGHIMIALYNHGSKPFTVTQGTRIAQGIFYQYLTTDTDALTGDRDNAPRKGGFGSTGTC